MSPHEESQRRQCGENEQSGPDQPGRKSHPHGPVDIVRLERHCRFAIRSKPGHPKFHDAGIKKNPGHTAYAVKK